VCAVGTLSGCSSTGKSLQLNSKKMSARISSAQAGEEGAKIYAMEVLLVDDQAVTTQVYAASVRKTFSGAKVHTAVDLPEALQIASGHPLDLVLLDLSLPTCTGIDALYRFRRAFPAVPVLVVSANEDKERIQACLEAGARGYITKTTAVAGLPAAMKAVLDGGRYIPAQVAGADLH
jgi:DNA-binding NarL/FixJ family response regulator